MKRTWKRDRYSFDRFNWYLSGRERRTLIGPRWLQVVILWLFLSATGPRSSATAWEEIDT